MKKFLLFYYACAIALPGLAADKYYLITSESSKGQNGGFYNPSYWSSNGGSNGTIKDEFDPDAEYVVYKKSGAKIYIKEAPEGKNYDFGGGSLVLGDGTSYGALFSYVNGESKALTFGENGLTIKCGAILLQSKNKIHVTKGPILVDTVDGAYAYVGFAYQDIKFSHRGSFSVSQGSTFTVGDYVFGLGGGALQGTFELPNENSCVGVLGTINVISTSNRIHNVMFDEYDATFSVASTDFPGTLCIGKNCHLNLLSGVLKVGTLVFDDNTWFTVPYDSESREMGRVDVTDVLTAGRGINVVLPSEMPSDEKKIPILTAPASSELSIRNFKLAVNSKLCWLTIETVGDRKILYATFPDVVQTKAHAELGISESWSDGTTSNENGKDYGLIDETNGVKATVTIVMPKDGSPYEFNGDSLNVHYGTILEWDYDPSQQILTCPYLRIFNGGTLHGNKKARLRIQGGVVDLVSGSILLGSSNERTLTVDSEIVGYAEAVLSGLSVGKSGSPHGYYAFNAINTNFYGTIKMRQRHWEDDGKVYINFDTSSRLTITNALSLGGNLLKLNPKALWLTRYASLLVEESTTLAAESNRGIYIEDVGRIRVGRKKDKPYTFRIETPLAINGTFYKEGTGTLELAGSMAFGEDGLAESPTEGLNGFVVTGGVVRVCSAGAIDGCSMLFHEGTSLELAVDFEDEELMAQGIRNVKTDTPFVLGEGVEKLPISLKFAEGVTAPSTKFTVPVLTVSANVAASVRDMLPAVKFPFKSYQATLVETVEKDAEDKPKYVTFAYELKYQALKVIVR